MKISFQVPGTSRMPDRTISARTTEGVILSVGYVAVATAAALITDVGEHADLAYYATIAQVIPVFLLAFVVDARARLREHFDRALEPIRRREKQLLELREFERSLPDHVHGDERVKSLRKDISNVAARQAEIRSDLGKVAGWAPRLLRDYVIVAVPGEVACLVALADSGGCSFAFWLAALSLAAMTALWVRSLGAPFALEEPMDHPLADDGSGTRSIA